MNLQQKLADQVFRFEFGNRIINLFRSLLLVLILVKLFEIPRWGYVVIILGYAVFVWGLGYLCDRYRVYKYFDKSYLTRSALIDEIDKIKTNTEKQGI